LAQGASAVVGGEISGVDRFVQPSVLVDVPEDALAVQEETFGPVLTIAAVPDMDEAVRLANASAYGLGASVFSQRRGMEIAGRLQTGMVSVNSVIAFTGIPALPFGGVKQSGFGRVHGADGLREFATTRAVARQRFAALLRVATFARTARVDRALATISTVRRGGRRASRAADRP
jgi:acyl-CoA reductase-like NAD-dependent aldehyde dehydrogenase